MMIVLTKRVRIPSSLLTDPKSVDYLEPGEELFRMSVFGDGTVQATTIAGPMIIPADAYEERKTKGWF